MLDTLDIFPISEVIYAKRIRNETLVNWLLYDVYKVAPNYPLQVSLFAHLMAEEYLEDDSLNATCPMNRNARVILAEKFLRKSTRDDLQGLRIKCGRAVSE